MKSLPPIREQVHKVAIGELTCEAIVEELLERIDAVDSSIEAWTHLDPDAALLAARHADKNQRSAPFRGLVFAAKDNFDTHDMPTRYGSPVHEGFRPGRDASCIATLRLGGGVLLGKTVTTEFAHRHPGKTHNPHHPEHTPGGSSSGSAAAVGSSMVGAAFGSQTTGSVIRPAAYCGAVGYKPTYGEINGSGMLANTPSFDTVGMITRYVDDLVVLRAALLGDELSPVTPPNISDLTIGYCRTPYWDQADAEARAMTDRAVNVLANAGARIEEFDGGGAFDGLDDANLCISGFEFARTMAHERLYALDALSPILRDGRMADGLNADYASYAQAQASVARLRTNLDRAMDKVDVVLTLPAPGAAPRGLASTGPATFNMPWTTLHVPALTLPVFESEAGLPIGIQLCGSRHDDRHVLACGTSISSVLQA
jgi:Asp-tRNA(Asn)/Glu-tRNA(Gln) amidotransferase A subunit family amidase